MRYYWYSVSILTTEDSAPLRSRAIRPLVNQTTGWKVVKRKLVLWECFRLVPFISPWLSICEWQRKETEHKFKGNQRNMKDMRKTAAETNCSLRIFFHHKKKKIVFWKCFGLVPLICRFLSICDRQRKETDWRKIKGAEWKWRKTAAETFFHYTFTNFALYFFPAIFWHFSTNNFGKQFETAFEIFLEY